MSGETSEHQSPTTTAQARQLPLLQSISFKIVHTLESFFYRLGFSIARNPAVYICSCFAVTILCGLGLLTFTPENRPDKLWIPWNSEFIRDTEWLKNNFPNPLRFHYAIVTAEDVLEPRVLAMLADIHTKVGDVRASGYSWKNLCFKVPVIKVDDNNGERTRRGRSILVGNSNSFSEFENEGNASPFLDPSALLPVELYCSILSSLDQECFEENLAELWNYNSTTILSLSREEILDTINLEEQISPVYGLPVKYQKQLGRIKRNATGHIVAAEAVMISWFASINRTAMNNGQKVTDEGTGQPVDTHNFLWEEKLTNFLLTYEPPEGVSLYFNVARSFGDISMSTIWADGYKLSIGFTIVFMYVIFMLGKFNWLEQRPFPSLAGLFSVGLSMVCAYGICSAFRIIYSPVHNVLPFLLLGLGIDDMFVIMQCWDNLQTTDKQESIPEMIGKTLKHAGVSITVTSVTDFFAFVIGATTVLPALQSFCIFAAVGIIATYAFQAIFFVASLAIDERRIRAQRNAFIPCITHPSLDIPPTCTKQGFAQTFIETVYCTVLFNRFTKILIISLTLGLLGVNVWGNFLLRQEFNPIWFLPKDTYLFKYFNARSNYFPEVGEEGFVFSEGVDLKSNLPKLEKLIFALDNTTVAHEIDSWYPPFKQYMSTNFGKDISSIEFKDKEFRKYLGKFLFSRSGGKFQSMFVFDGNLTCGKPTPNPILTFMRFKFKSFLGPEQQIAAMNSVKEVVHHSNFTPEKSHTFVWSFGFATWETDEIISAEMYRNMGLAMLCIFATTLVLLANLKASSIVLLCVVLTLVDVGGSMHFWNLTIDTISCIDLVLAIGLSVDFSVHICHTFMTKVGTREERAKAALVSIGAAVFNGGFSTFLAFIFLANSKSHVFITFFKIFFLVVAYGLFHGLVFLPILLSLLGPEPYVTSAALSKSESCPDREAEMHLMLTHGTGNE